MAEGRRDPQPGDLIEIERSFYDHWAVYVGDGFVIHVTDEGASRILASSTSVCAGKAKVKKELLREVVKNDNWRVNKYDRSCTPRPLKEIIRRAEQWIGVEVTYDVLNRNCEHFVTMLRYGEGVCEQAETVLQNFNSISSVVMAGIGVGSLIAAAGIPVVGLPLAASASFAVAGSGSLLASIGFISSNIVLSLTFAQFEKAGRDILETTCC